MITRTNESNVERASAHDELDAKKFLVQALVAQSQANVPQADRIPTPDIVTKCNDDYDDIADAIELGLDEYWDDTYEEFRFKSHKVIVDYTAIRRDVCHYAEESRVMWNWFEGSKVCERERTEQCTIVKWMAHLDHRATAELWMAGHKDWAVYEVEADR